MVMISSRWPSLLLGVVAVVSSASAYHSSSPGYHSTGCTDVHIGDGYCDNQNVRESEEVAETWLWRPLSNITAHDRISSRS